MSLQGHGGRDSIHQPSGVHPARKGTAASAFFRRVVMEAVIEVSQQEVIPLSDFIHEFGEGLLSAVQQQNPPIYDGVPNSRHAILMEALLRKPFPPQQDAVQAVTRL